MKKLLIPMILISVLITSACSKQDTKSTTEETKSKTITYQSETGPIKVPANPKRIVILNSSVSGHVMALEGNIVGIDTWSKADPIFSKYIKNATEVSADNIEKIIELKPDLIIGASTDKNIDKLSKIAPTVTYTYNKVDYLTQYLEIGKLLNKEKAAQTWIDDFKKRAKKAGEDIKAKIGENATISVMENSDKQIYVFGDNWGRGTEILYKEMKLKMPNKVKEMALKAGYYALSPEVLPDYAGDYVIFSKSSTVDNSFQKTTTYKNIPAVKNNHLFEVDAKTFYFNDPISLDYQLDFFIKSLLGK